MKKKQKKKVIRIIVLAVAAIALIIVFTIPHPFINFDDEAVSKVTVTVAKAVDGEAVNTSHEYKADDEKCGLVIDLLKEYSYRYSPDTLVTAISKRNFQSNGTAYLVFAEVNGEIRSFFFGNTSVAVVDNVFCTVGNKHSEIINKLGEIIEK